MPPPGAEKKRTQQLSSSSSRKGGGSSSKKSKPSSSTDRQQQQQQQHGDAMGAGAPAAPAQPAPAQPAADDSLRRLLRAWQWKREHLPDAHRFRKPYLHSMVTCTAADGDSDGSDSARAGGSNAPQQAATTTATPTTTLTIRQARFGAEGFASTVWDSSIVLAKLLEKRGPPALAGRRCLDLSAGCGLIGIVMAKLGAAAVTATDLAGNLTLLQDNVDANGGGGVVTVAEHRWGEDASSLGPPFDVIAACDVMYVEDLVPALLASLVALSGPASTVYVAHGRNRAAEPAFKAAAAAHFHIELVPPDELDEVYQCSDVSVLRLTPRAA